AVGGQTTFQTGRIFEVSTGNRTRGGDEGGRDEQGGAGLDGGANVRDFSRTDRIVVKIGTNILTARASWEGGLPETSFNGKPIKEGQIDLAFLERMAGQISGLREQRSEERRCRERVYVEVGAGT